MRNLINILHILFIYFTLKYSNFHPVYIFVCSVLLDPNLGIELCWIVEVVWNSHFLFGCDVTSRVKCSKHNIHLCRMVLNHMIVYGVCLRI